MSTETIQLKNFKRSTNIFLTKPTKSTLWKYRWSVVCKFWVEAFVRWYFIRRLLSLIQVWFDFLPALKRQWMMGKMRWLTFLNDKLPSVISPLVPNEINAKQRQQYLISPNSVIRDLAVIWMDRRLSCVYSHESIHSYRLFNLLLIDLYRFRIFCLHDVLCLFIYLQAHGFSIFTLLF